MEKEIWKYIIGYEGIYEVSSFGRVKSLKFGEERILKQCLNGHGYFQVCLTEKGIPKVRKVHQLVAETFLGHKPDGTHKLVVNHIDFNKLNNQIKNLEIITNRQNANKKHLKSSSEYVGVYWNKNSKKWTASIDINRKQKYLGLFDTEIEASEYYENALKAYINGEEIVIKKILFKGYSWSKNRNKWESSIWINGKKKHLGYFTNETDANNSYKNALSLLKTINYGKKFRKSVEADKQSNEIFGITWK